MGASREAGASRYAAVNMKCPIVMNVPTGASLQSRFRSLQGFERSQRDHAEYDRAHQGGLVEQRNGRSGKRQIARQQMVSGPGRAFVRAKTTPTGSSPAPGRTIKTTPAKPNAAPTQPARPGLSPSRGMASSMTMMGDR